VTGKHRQTEETEEPAEPLIVRDRRKIDPDTGEVRPEPEPEEAGPSGPSLGESIVDEAVEVTSDIEKELAERTADLQRLQAEYANYRKRVERDREVVIASAKASVVADLLPLLDDIERAELHGDLTGAFKAVADKLAGSLQRSGLEAFGKENEPFDPSVHEAVQHSTSPEVTGPTVTTVLRRGYRFGDRILRAALVGVTDHEPAPEPREPEVVDAPAEGELPLDGNERSS
jgi:molecular chaperone GrpE